MMGETKGCLIALVTSGAGHWSWMTYMVGVGQMSDIQSEVFGFFPAKIEKTQDSGILSNFLDDIGTRMSKLLLGLRGVTLFQCTHHSYHWSGFITHKALEFPYRKAYKACVIFIHTAFLNALISLSPSASSFNL
jgi:hypothetical protein